MLDKSAYGNVIKLRLKGQKETVTRNSLPSFYFGLFVTIKLLLYGVIPMPFLFQI
jgi:hypothetical protein